MSSHAVTVGLEYDGIPVENEAGRLLEITGVGEIGDAAALHLHQSDVAVWIAHLRHKFYGKQTAVGAPYCAHAVVLTRIRLAVGELAHSFRGQVHHHEVVPVLHKSHLLSVGRYERTRIFITAPCGHFNHRFLSHGCGGGKIGVVLACYGCLVDVLMSRPLGSIVQ